MEKIVKQGFSPDVYLNLNDQIYCIDEGDDEEMDETWFVCCINSIS